MNSRILRYTIWKSSKHLSFRYQWYQIRSHYFSLFQLQHTDFVLKSLRSLSFFSCALTPKLPVKIAAQGFGGAPPTIYLDFRGPPMQPEVDRLSSEHGSAVRLSLREVTRKRLPNIKIFFWKSWVLKKATEISNNGYWMNHSLSFLI